MPARPSSWSPSGTTLQLGHRDRVRRSLPGATSSPPQYLPALGSRPIFASEGNHGFTRVPALSAGLLGPHRGTDVGRPLHPGVLLLHLDGARAHIYPSAWYAFDWGSARFYVLDGAWADSQGAYQGDFLAHWNGPVSGCGPCGAELQWLKSDLAAHASTPIKFAFFHYPLYADNGGEGSDTYLDGPSSLEGLLGQQQRRHRVQRPRPSVRAQLSPDRRQATGELRHGHRGRPARQRQRLQRVRRLRHRLRDRRAGHPTRRPMPTSTVSCWSR